MEFDNLVAKLEDMGLSIKMHHYGVASLDYQYDNGDRLVVIVEQEEPKSIIAPHMVLLYSYVGNWNGSGGDKRQYDIPSKKEFMTGEELLEFLEG